MSRMRTKKRVSLRYKTAKRAVLCAFLGLFGIFSCLAGGLPPVILLGPGDATVSTGDTVSFSVTVVSLSQLTYQWYVGTYPIAGATGASYTFKGVMPKDAGNIFVAVTNAGGGLISGPAVLKVIPDLPAANGDAYTVTQNISSVTAAPGVLANDTDPNGSSLSAVLVTGPSHGTLNLKANGGFSYLAATNYYGTDSFKYRAYDPYTNSAITTVSLSVVAPPTITNQPEDALITAGQNASFSVGAAGSGTVSYQWQFNGVPLTHGTNAWCVISNAGPSDIGNYTVSVSNAFGSVTSAAAVLLLAAPTVTNLTASAVTVTTAAVAAAVNPQGQATGYYFEFGLTTNYGLFTFTNQLPAGTNSAQISGAFTNLTPATTYHYRAVAVNTGGSAVSADATFSTRTIPPMAVGGSVMNVGTNALKHMQLSVTSTTGGSFTVFSSSDMSVPPSAWPAVGTMTEVAPGQYQFTDPSEATNLRCFYRIQPN
jgi:hypothetical protein